MYAKTCSIVFECGVLTDVSQNAAVDVENVSVDEVGGIGSEEYSRTHEVFGRTPAACRSLGDDELIEGMT